MSTHPFSGIRVLDFSQGVAGPHCGMLFALYGADVIKVEPPEGDWSRPLGTSDGTMSALFAAYNQGKRGLALDVRKTDEHALARELVRGADVLIENYRPGVGERLGLDYETLSSDNEKLIHVSISGFGLAGPESHRPATDSILQAYCGLVNLNRGLDGVPHRIRFPAIDHVTGLYAFQAAIVALVSRGMSGRGQHLDTSLFQSTVAFQGGKILDHHASGGHAPEEPYSPLGIYPTKDGLISISTVRERHFRDLCTILGCRELANDPRFESNDRRMQRIDELNTILAEHFEQRTTDDWARRLTAQGIMNSTIRTYDELLADEHVAESDAIRMVAQPGLDQVPIARVPGTANSYKRPAPRLGEHNAEILDELAKLRHG
ncbi:MAG: CoA transferase [Hyphomicrobiaceae bacterium]